MVLECFVLRSDFKNLAGENSVVFSLRIRGGAPLRLYRDDDGSGRMIKIKIDEVKNE